MSTTNAAKDLDAIYKSIRESISQAGFAMQDTARIFTAATDDMARASVSLGDDISGLREGFEQFIQDINNLGNVANKISGSLGTSFKASMEMLTGTLRNVSEGAIDMAKQANDITDSLDKGTDTFRDYKAMIADIGFGFGKTYEESQKFGNSLRETVNKTNFGLFIDPGEIILTAKAFAEAGMSLENLNKTIDTSIGKFTILETVVTLQNRTGMDRREIVNAMTDATIKQGFSIEEATRQIAAYSDVAEKTGLTVKDVKNSLEGTANQFSELGLSAEFSRPFLENFVRSLESVGMGIKNATGLSSTLSRSLVGLSQDYSKAFITFQRGGLDMGGGGGLLGAAISLEDRIMSARTSEEQQDLAMELGGAMSDTLASFGGGQIVTVRDAMERPELMSQLAVQKQLLSQMYNITGTQASRTLELLKQLKDSDDPEEQRRLGDQLKESVIKQDDTLDEAQKTNKNLKQLTFQATLGNELTLQLMQINRDISRGVGDEYRDNIVKMSDKLTDEKAKQTQADYEMSVREARKKIQEQMDMDEYSYKRELIEAFLYLKI